MSECHISHVRNIFSDKNSSPPNKPTIYFRFDTSFAALNISMFAFAPPIHRFGSFSQNFITSYDIRFHTENTHDACVFVAATPTKNLN